MNKAIELLNEELGFYYLRLQVVRFLLNVFPPYTGNRIRTALYRLIGFSIGHGTLFRGTPNIVGRKNIYSRLVIGSYCSINQGCVLDLFGEIKIGNYVTIGPLTTIITGTHKIGGPGKRTGEVLSGNVEIGDGTWVCAHCLILPGVRIGAGSVIAAGSVVTEDVPENTLVGGDPARFIRSLEK